MGRTIGIDLGTTNTVVALFDRGRPRVLEDGKGYKVLPSVVYQREDGSYVVGQAAKSHVLTSPDRSVYAIKRLIGRRFKSPQAQSAIEQMPYEIQEGPEGGCVIKVGEELLSPIELSAIVLQVARQIAEESLGEEVDNAVITVPAYFNHAQRQATLQAAALAGLNCERLLNEPTAAALAYGFRKDQDKNVLIYDLGGGTFDVSILHLSDGVYEVMSTSGDTYLGGEDFDNRIVQFLSDRFKVEHRVDLMQDNTAKQRLRDAAERAKCELSFTESTRLLIPRITADHNLESTLNRRDLEGLVEDLIQRTLSVVRETISAAGLSIPSIDDIVLVGGQTRMPRVREAISALFRKEPSKSVHPEEVVALGASVHAESLDAPSQMRTLLIDVTPFDLGIDAAGGYFSTIIDRNTRIPFTSTRAFTTASDNQERARITVRQGASNRAKDNERLGEFILSNLGGGARMERKVDVTFRLDVNGILHTSAVDRASGERKVLVIEQYANSAQSPSFPEPEEQEEQEFSLSPQNAATGAKSSSGGLFTGLLASFGRKAQEPKRMELAVPDRPMPERQAPLPSDGPPPPPLGEEQVDDPISLDLASMEELPMEESGPSPLDMLPEDAPLFPEQGLPSIDLDGPLPSIDLMGDNGLEELEGLDPFAEGAAYQDEALPEIPDLPLMDLEEMSSSPAPVFAQEEEDPFAGLGDDLFSDEGISDALLGDDLMDAFEQPEPSLPTPARSGELGDLSLDESLDLDFDEEPLRPAILEEDLFDAGELFGAFPGQIDPEPEAAPVVAAPKPPPMPDVPRSPKRRSRKPARLKMNYRSRRAFVREYRANLEQGSTFIKADKPLREGRECIFEIRAPGLTEPVVLEGVVTWSSRKRQLQRGEKAGMSIEYRLSAQQAESLNFAIESLDQA